MGMRVWRPQCSIPASPSPLSLPLASSSRSRRVQPISECDAANQPRLLKSGILWCSSGRLTMIPVTSVGCQGRLSARSKERPLCESYLCPHLVLFHVCDNATYATCISVIHHCRRTVSFFSLFFLCVCFVYLSLLSLASPSSSYPRCFASTQCLIFLRGRPPSSRPGSSRFSVAWLPLHPRLPRGNAVKTLKSATRHLLLCIL